MSQQISGHFLSLMVTTPPQLKLRQSDGCQYQLIVAKTSTKSNLDSIQNCVSQRHSKVSSHFGILDLTTQGYQCRQKKSSFLPAECPVLWPQASILHRTLIWMLSRSHGMPVSLAFRTHYAAWLQILSWDCGFSPSLHLVYCLARPECRTVCQFS